MPESTLVRFRPLDDAARKLVLEPHTVEGYWTLVEYQREQGDWRFAGETLVTDLLVRPGVAAVTTVEGSG
jgi:hypothetical protein